MKSYVENPTVQKHRWLILSAIGMFTIMSTLDGSIVNIALPVISHDLKIPTNQVEWVVSIYLIVICAFLPLMGKLGDTLGKIKVFKLGTILFTLGSLLAGFNQSLALLLIARVVQALGASMTMALNNGIITEVFPVSERGKSLGMIGSFVAVGSISGPGLGGLILGQLPWGYIFWINIPLGLATILLGQIVLPKDIINNHETKIDWRGFFSFISIILPLFFGIFLGQEVGFTKLPILGLFLVALIALVVFIRVETTQNQPLIPLKLFKNKEFTISLMAGFMIFVVNFYFNVVAPFYFENARGLSAMYTGYLLMIFPLVQIVISPLAGTISDRIGPYLITVVGLSAILLVQLGLISLNLQTSWWLIGGLIALFGFGNGVFQSPNNTLVMSAVETKNLGIAGSLNALARNLGMVVAVSSATTVLFKAMSVAAKHEVKTYVPQHPEWFIYGMRVAFLFSAVLCLITVSITVFRMLKMKK